MQKPHNDIFKNTNVSWAWQVPALQIMAEILYSWHGHCVLDFFRQLSQACSPPKTACFSQQPIPFPYSPHSELIFYECARCQLWNWSFLIARPEHSSHELTQLSPPAFPALTILLTIMGMITLFTDNVLLIRGLNDSHQLECLGSE